VITKKGEGMVSELRGLGKLLEGTSKLYIGIEVSPE
jgi:hypothetical protein